MWTDNQQYTTVQATDSRPLIGVTGGGRAMVGDKITLTFEDDGQEVETVNGDAIRFDVIMERSTFPVLDNEGAQLEDGAEATLMTSSARFLSKLAEVMPVAGKTVNITIDGTGYDAAYSVGISE
jgi:hypothetical protein